MNKFEKLKEMIDNIGCDPWGIVKPSDIIKPLKLIVKILEETQSSNR